LERGHDTLLVHKIGTVGICGNKKCGLSAQNTGKPTVFLKTMCTPKDSTISFDKQEMLNIFEKQKQPSQCRGYRLSNMNRLFPFIRQLAGQVKIPLNAIWKVVIQSSDFLILSLFY
jgi:hypothetical protein